ncbi:MAG: NADP-specific glutamate dehydrogenase [Candidatus Adiutrix sp.]|jgi:glutamate dehydrogenase (NADP+)|nr:NADP-specific glutamate dehydrogenase [Candidatus Adiutrix sp.]
MSYVKGVLDRLAAQNAGEPEFLQAAREVLTTIAPLADKDPKYEKHSILERMLEPDRTIIFRVTWLDDQNNVRVNRGFRVQYNEAIGPYKGGLRFHPSVSLSVIKFLGFEQVFKNSLTGLAIGGGKGGSDFDPKGRSEGEIMRFCQSFMTELFKYLGPTIDVPAGDIGVGGREIGYLFGQYKRLTSEHNGVLTGKGLGWGGSLGRTQATGYGAVYLAQDMMRGVGQDLEGRTCLVSGSGNVAIHAIEKLYQVGARPVTCSDSQGFIHDKNGIDLEVLKKVKEVERARLTLYKKLVPKSEYTPVEKYPKGRNAVWNVPGEAAFPCATQNELNGQDAKALLKNGCLCVSEGANMPSDEEAMNRFLAAKICYAPGKAANAGGVATSQLEMAQNASMQSWTFEEVDNRLKGIMRGIYTASAQTAREFGDPTNLVMGANIAGFRKVAQAMIDLGAI